MGGGLPLRNWMEQGEVKDRGLSRVTSGNSPRDHQMMAYCSLGTRNLSTATCQTFNGAASERNNPEIPITPVY